MSRKKLLAMVGAVVVLSMTLSACLMTPTPEIIIETVVVEKTVETIVEKVVEKVVEKTQEPVTDGLKTLVICQSQEPDTLYWYGGSTLAARHIQHAIYDGPIDNRTYAYQAVILEKLPSTEDGDAIINAVTVQAGDIVVDDYGDPVELAEGMMVRPYGCYSTDCAVEFEGPPMEMDQMFVTFKLVDGLKWSDGEDLTVDDSVYTFELAADPSTPVSKFTIDRTASYEALDDKTAMWIGLPGYIDKTYFTNFWPPLPRHLWQEELGYGPADLLEAEESSRIPIGWGAFVIKEWVPGDHITVEKNPLYYRASEGLPYMDTIIFRFVSDPNSAVAQLISGECDIVTQDALSADLTPLLLKLEQESVVGLASVASSTWEHVDFGISPASEYDRPDFFGDVRMRQAFAYCLDRQLVADTVLYGLSSVLDSYLPLGYPYYAGDLTEYPYDPEQGQALLEEMGWVDSDSDGVRKAKDVEGVLDGTPLEFTWLSTTNATRIQSMQIWQQNLADCGFMVSLENVPVGQYFASGPEGPLFGRRFDVTSFTSSVEPSCNRYLSSGVPSADNGWIGENVSGFAYPDFDAACNRALAALPGTTDYIEGYQDAQRIFSEQLPVLPLFLHYKLALIRPEVDDFIMDATEDSAMWNIEAFDIQ
ncbi:MAG: peptide ABC transporter substrate-binding protein [Anaerolineae bacterium]|nr:peptide ABC transporter substrate-binding protein [Anaerolineae bacterium]